MNLDRIAKMAAAAIILFCAFRSVMAFDKIDMLGEKGPFSNAITLMCAFAECLIWGLAAVLTFVAAFLRDLSDTMISTLLMPRKYRKRPAPLLSPIQGLILREEFDEARRRLEKLAGEEPGCALIRQVWFQMELTGRHAPADAIRVAERCFADEERECSPEYYRILRAWHNLTLSGDGDPDAVKRVIRNELKQHRRIYSPHQRRELSRLIS